MMKVYSRRQLMAKAPEEDWSKHYLTFKVLSEGTITIVTTTAAQAKTIQYSVDNGSTWTSITSSTTVRSLGTFSEGDKVLVKGNNSAYGNNVSWYNHFGGTAKVELRGNIMSLTYGDNFEDKTSYSASFAICGLFYSYTNLVSAKKLVLPATTLKDRCYLNLFRSCTALKEPPAVLPATVCKDLCYQGMFQDCSSLLYIPYFKVSTMAIYCFNAMFSGCRSLTDLSGLEISSTASSCCFHMFSGCTSLTTKVPKLSAKTLASDCYGYMFDGCSNLTKAPDLPALTLVSNCYERMFRNCSKLKYIKAMFTTTPSTSYTNVWVSGVPSGGTFVKNSAATWDVKGTSGIPNNWTVQTADE